MAERSVGKAIVLGRFGGGENGKGRRGEKGSQSGRASNDSLSGTGRTLLAGGNGLASQQPGDSKCCEDGYQSDRSETSAETVHAGTGVHGQEAVDQTDQRQDPMPPSQALHRGHARKTGAKRRSESQYVRGTETMATPTAANCKAGSTERL
jgi:hypothetical protein